MRESIVQNEVNNKQFMPRTDKSFSLALKELTDGLSLTLVGSLFHSLERNNNNTCNTGTIYRSTLQPLLLLSCLPADILFQPLAFETHGQCNQTATGIKIIII